VKYKQRGSKIARSHNNQDKENYLFCVIRHFPFHFIFYSALIAPVGQASAQLPQSVHLSASIT
jgi:hypothetical protein